MATKLAKVCCDRLLSAHSANFIVLPFVIVTHTHPFNGSFSGTTQVSRYQKGKTNLDFTEARDSEWQWHQLGNMQASTLLQTDNHTSTPPLSFLQAGCPSCRPTNSVNLLIVIVNKTIFVVRLFCATSPPAPWGNSPSAHPLVTPLARGRQLVLYVGPTNCQHVWLGNTCSICRPHFARQAVARDAAQPQQPSLWRRAGIHAFKRIIA